jgi:hypothetical protein
MTHAELLIIRNALDLAMLNAMDKDEDTTEIFQTILTVNAKLFAIK